MRWTRSLVVGFIGFMAGGPVAPALAADPPRSVPPGLSATHETSHFVLHYDPATTTAEYAQAGAGDFEEARSRLVAAGGGTPNAGLLAPVADADGKTDVYLSAPAFDPTFKGGMVVGDTGPADGTPRSAYVFMTPDLERRGFRFRAAHEFMHVVEKAYANGLGLLTESAADWAADWSLPDIDPLDSNFRYPEHPLDCSYGTWNGVSCGNGYRQWLFIELMVERYGVAVVDSLLKRQKATCSAGCSPTLDRQILDAEINGRSASADTVSSLYGLYMRDLLDPTRWTTTAVASMHAASGPPVRTVTIAHQTLDTGARTVTVDHLATRYVAIDNVGGFISDGPNAKLRVTVDHPQKQAASLFAVRELTGGGTAPADVRADFQAEQNANVATVGVDPATVGRVWLPLVNTTPSTDAMSITYRIEYLRDPAPTPPVNDEPGGAPTARLGVEATTDNAYAGGNGTDEAPDCPFAQDASRGVWFRFTTPNAGSYTFTAQGSDFAAVVSLRAEDGSFGGCSGNGRFAAWQRPATTSLVYVGRHHNATGYGHTVRLTVTGPGASPVSEAPPTPPAPPVADQPPVGTQPVADAPHGTTITTTCRRAQRAYTKAKQLVTKRKAQLRKAKGKKARGLATKRYKSASKAFGKAKQRRAKACLRR